MKKILTYTIIFILTLAMASVVFADDGVNHVDVEVTSEPNEKVLILSLESENPDWMQERHEEMKAKFSKEGFKGGCQYMKRLASSGKGDYTKYNKFSTFRHNKRMMTGFASHGMMGSSNYLWVLLLKILHLVLFTFIVSLVFWGTHNLLSGCKKE